MNNAKVQPWERQPGETEKQFEAFAIYRDLGSERSVNEVCKRLSKSRTLISKWSSQNQWVSRATAYDNDLQRQAHRKARKQAADTKKRHVQIAMSLEKKALEALNLLKPEEMTARDIKETLRLAIEIERKILIDDFDIQDQAEIPGQPDEQTAESATINVAGLSNEELNQLENILEKIQ